ncbi:LysM peptidoglycan-binding domain-containing protein [Microbacterium sp. NPDC076911]|uniref:muramidase family protein n=1 Tax=Microbacterium sp. NPDC076911 TaxID=3154958 RepID=UPI003428C5AB
MAVGIPTALAGAVALALSSSPAHAEDRAATTMGADERAFRALPALPATPVVSASSIPAVTVSAIKPAATTPATYTVVRGDTVSAIASRHGLRTTDVLTLNALAWKSVIYPGQVLKLGGTATAITSTETTSTSASSASTSGTYTVTAGDTISAIASRHGSTTSAVLKANGLSMSSIIYPGQSISIPGATTTITTSPEPEAPSSNTSTSTSNTSTSTSSASGSYTIQAGDTISAIASRNGVSTNAVLAANGLSLSSIIYPGQTISIPGSTTSTAIPAASTSTSTAAPSLDAEQTANAILIIQVGRDLGVSDRGIAIALGTAMQESWIRNLDWGDRDSLGLFQQRPSTGWGTAEQVSDPVRSIKTFFGGPSDPNGYNTRGLLDIPGWQSMTFAEAAQAVQISAYPDRYAQWEAPAYAWLAALG